MGDESGSLPRFSTPAGDSYSSGTGGTLTKASMQSMSAGEALRAARDALCAGDGVPRAMSLLKGGEGGAEKAPAFGRGARTEGQLRDALRRANRRCEELTAWADHLQDEVEAERRATEAVTAQLRTVRSAVSDGIRAMTQLDRRPELETAVQVEARFARRVEAGGEAEEVQDALTSVPTGDLVRKFDDLQRGFFARVADSLRAYRRRAEEEARRTAAEEGRANSAEGQVEAERRRRKEEVAAMFQRLEEYGDLGDENLRLLEQLEAGAKERAQASRRHAEFATRLLHYVQLLHTDVERQLGFVPASRTVDEDGLLELVHMSGLEAEDAERARADALRRLKRRRDLQEAAAANARREGGAE